MTSLPDYDDALHAALAVAEPLDRSEPTSLESAAGRVLAEEVVADRDMPPFDRAQMDGYALRAAEVGAGRSWPVVRTVAAGSPAGEPVPAGSCVAIATGAPMPPGPDTVIQHELSDRGDPVRFQVDVIEPGHAVHPRGVDARAGETVVPRGMILNAHHLGLAASVGRAELRVEAAPRSVVLSSGDELVPVGASPEPHQIRDSNAYLVAAHLRSFGGGPVTRRHVRDDRAATIDAVGAALGSADLLVTIGGVSAGARDHLPDAFEAHGVVRALRGARIQPGRPIIVGRAPSGCVVVGLPGNPVSALACTCLFVWPIVRRLLGLDAQLPWRPVELAEPVRANARRRAFRPAMIAADGRALVPAWAGSGDLVHTGPTAGLIELPVSGEPVAGGTRLRFLPWPGGHG